MFNLCFLFCAILCITLCHYFQVSLGSCLLTGVHLPVIRTQCVVRWVVVAAKLLQSCPTLCNPIDGSPPGSSVPGILQARILECVALPCSRGSSRPRAWSHISHGPALLANSLQLSYLESLLMSFICLKQIFGFLLSLRKKIYVCTVLRLFRLSPTPASLNPFSVPLPLVLYTSTMANGI